MKKAARRVNSGNIFLDLGFEPAEAAVLLMRSQLMIDITEYIAKKKLSQVEAARRLGVSQARVSDLVRGKIEKFSLDMLVTLEERLGRHFEVRRAA